MPPPMNLITVHAAIGLATIAHPSHCHHDQLNMSRLLAGSSKTRRSRPMRQKSDDIY